jgi:hypothetical protein
LTCIEVKYQHVRMLDVIDLGTPRMDLDHVHPNEPALPREIDSCDENWNLCTKAYLPLHEIVEPISRTNRKVTG